MEAININKSVFNSPYRNHIHWVSINGIKVKIQFHNHTHETTNEEHIAAIRKEIELYKNNGLQPDMFEKNEWEELEASQPKEVAVTIEGEQFKVDVNDLKNLWVKEHLGKKSKGIKVNTGTKGSVKMEETK